jgi:hypothetical protein
MRIPSAALAPSIRRLHITIRIPAKINSMLDLFRYKIPGEKMWRASDLLNLVRPFIAYENDSDLYIPSSRYNGFERLSLHENPLDSYPSYGAHTTRFAQQLMFYEEQYHQGNYSYTSCENEYLSDRTMRSQRNRLTHWQPRFRNLDLLAVVLKVNGCLDDRARQFLSELPSKAETCLKSRKTNVVARIAGDCKDKTTYWGGRDVVSRCDGRCKEFVERVFNEIMRGVPQLRRIWTVGCV